MTRYTIGVFALLLLALRAPAVAQVATSDSTAETDLGSPWPSVAAGLGIGAIGLIGGAAFGAAASTDAEFGGLVGAYMGGVIGMSLGMAMGVHLGNQRRGDAALSFLSGLAFAVVAPLVLSEAFHGVSAELLLVVPLAQVGLMTYVERRTAEQRPRDRRTEAAGSVGNGQVALGARLRF